MTYMQIQNAIKQGLNVGGNLSAAYLKRFQEAFNGDKRSIESFTAHYNDEGGGVVFEYTVNGNVNTVLVEIQKSIWGYKPDLEQLKRQMEEE